jgi:single-strand DNA-binding protein
MSTRSLNKVLLIGNLTRDPELRYTPQGTAVCTFGIATNRQWTPADGGETQEEAEFHRIVAWAKLAEICSQILYKGRKAYVEGRLQTRTWTGQDGQERTTTEVVIDSMIALGPPKSGAPEDLEEYVGEPQGKGGQQASASDVTDDQEEEKEEKKGSTKKSSKSTKAKTEVKKKEEQEEISEDDIPF